MLRSRRMPRQPASVGCVCRIEPNGAVRVVKSSISGASIPLRQRRPPIRGKTMVISATEISPLVALLAGILILIVPRLLNYIVALYLIIVGVTGLNAIHHFIQ